MRNPELWWKKTRLLAWLAAAAILAFVTGAALLAGIGGQWQLAFVPLASFLGLTLAPFGVAGAVYWLALRQEIIDRQQSVWESR